MQIGVYSGTFDPIHEGHVLFAQVAIEQFGLDRVVIIPEQSPRYKKTVTDFDLRSEMIRLATSDSNQIELFDQAVEAVHTVDGVMQVVSESFSESELYLLLGSDVYEKISNWGLRSDESGGAAELSKLAKLIVGIKAGDSIDNYDQIAEQNKLSVSYIEVPLAKLSSSQLREALRSQKRPVGLNDDVYDFIQRQKLYRS